MLKKRTAIPNNARFDFASRVALETLIEYNVRTLPVEPTKIAENSSYSIQVASYSEWCKFHHEKYPNLSLSAMQNDYGKDGVTLYSRNDNEYIQKVTQKYMTQFMCNSPTNALFAFHSIIVKKYFEKTQLNRGGLDENEYKVLEQEADCFAAEFLAPQCIVKAYHNYKSHHDVSLIFNISGEAAKNRAKNVPINASLVRLSPYIKRNFHDFVSNGKYKENMIRSLTAANWSDFDEHETFYRVCKECGEVLDKHHKHCFMCGEKVETTRFSDMLRQFAYKIVNKPNGKIETVLIDPCVSFEFVSKNQRLAYCPVCKNSDLHTDSKNCHICGTSINNYCEDCNKTVDIKYRASLLTHFVKIFEQKLLILQGKIFALC